MPAALRDLRILHHRPDLADAFYSGYGHPLSAEEKAPPTKYAVLDVLDAVRWGVEHHDIDLVDETHTMVANLRAERTCRAVGW
jgi:hypothetical protein